MAESPLARLLRLKKEKEQANGTAPLEAVQGQSSEVGGGEGNNAAGANYKQGSELLLGEKDSEEKEGTADSLSPSDSVPVVEPVSTAEVIQAAPTKPMSAMERLRALKSGGSSNGSVSVSTTNAVSTASANGATSDNNLADDSKEEITLPAAPPKPRKTHPIAMEMAELEQALDAQVPGFVSILSQIHKKLRADPDVVTLLDDEEIAVIVAGLEKHTNVTIVAPSAIKAAKSKAKKEPVSAMDL